MTCRRPPRLGVVLLERLVPDNEPLTGDLLEAASGRSDAWFWQQVLPAVLVRTVGLVFVVGLFVGIGSRSLCEHLPRGDTEEARS
jgi:hypothetical protein